MLGFPMQAVYRPLDLKPLDTWVRESREKRGLTLAFELASPPAEHYQTNRIDAALTPHQTAAMARLKHTLFLRHAMLDGGRHVESAADAVRWLLEQF